MHFHSKQVLPYVASEVLHKILYGVLEYRGSAIVSTLHPVP